MGVGRQTTRREHRDRLPHERHQPRGYPDGRDDDGPRISRADGHVLRDADARQRLNSIFSKARSKDQLKAMGSLTEVVDGQWRIADDPPTVSHINIPGGADSLSKTFSDYRGTLAENRRELVERY